MKDDEKDKETGTEPSGEPTEEPKQMDRGKFLKAIGVGIGAVGLGVVTGGQLSARTGAEPDSSRSAIQKLMRGLLESPSKARDFLNNPQTVAAEFGVSLTGDDAKTIQLALNTLTTELALREGHNQTSHDKEGHFNWHNETTKAAPAKEGTTTTKPPKNITPPTRRR